jgi:hypothetical protein
MKNFLLKINFLILKFLMFKECGNFSLGQLTCKEYLKNNSQKLTTIKEKGIPFETIIYKKGHVLLYVGTVDNTVLVMHNIWGIRTKDKMGVTGRVVIGRAVVSTLELGSEIENFDSDNMLLSTVTSMNIFTRTPNVLVQKKVEKSLKL